jgi:ketosteroid isomerase-like protein
MRPEDVFEYGNAGACLEEIATVRAIYDAFARRDLEGALEHVAEDLTFSPQGTAQLIGRSEPYRGSEGLRQYFADVARVWDDLTLHATDIRATLGGVVVFGRVEGTVDGRRIEVDALWTWQVRDGKAVSMRATALGEMPHRS